MKKTSEVIGAYEYITAGRFYRKTQKEAILNLVTSAEFIDEQELNILKNLIFSEEIEDYKTETDCANGILMYSLINTDDYKKEILISRRRTIEKLVEKCLFDDHESWLKLINSDKRDFTNLFEKAIYLYSVHRPEKALTILKQLAEANHYLSVKLTAALCKDLHIEAEEARYLIILNRIKDELLYGEMSIEQEKRLRELQIKIPEQIIADAYNKEITYFDEDMEFGKPIGFSLF